MPHPIHEADQPAASPLEADAPSQEVVQASAVGADEAPPGGAAGKSLSEAAKRALREAAVRRAAAAALEPPAHPGEAEESGGPKGPEPTRFGDWERKGLAIDF
jgi:hypothetical protein